MGKEQKAGPSGEALERDGSKATIRFTEQMCEHIGEIAWIELPELGTSVQQGDVVIVIESGKAAHDYVSPLSGKIAAVNRELAQNPGLLSLAQNWLFQLEGIDEEEWERL